MAACTLSAAEIAGRHEKRLQREIAEALEVVLRAGREAERQPGSRPEAGDRA